eukprot:12856709-Alexandrium_andersonii.AAC.1
MGVASEPAATWPGGCNGQRRLHGRRRRASGMRRRTRHAGRRNRPPALATVSLPLSDRQRQSGSLIGIAAKECCCD